jgi:hypothetical protein
MTLAFYPYCHVCYCCCRRRRHRRDDCVFVAVAIVATMAIKGGGKLFKLIKRFVRA